MTQNRTGFNRLRVGFKIELCSADMTKSVPLLASLVVLLACPVFAADSTHPASSAPAAADDKVNRQNPLSVRSRKPSTARPIAFRTIQH
jgi:hypothetical protein